MNYAKNPCRGSSIARAPLCRGPVNGGPPGWGYLSGGLCDHCYHAPAETVADAAREAAPLGMAKVQIEDSYRYRTPAAVAADPRA